MSVTPSTQKSESASHRGSTRAEHAMLYIGTLCVVTIVTVVIGKSSCSRLQAIQNIIYHVQSNKGVHPQAGTFAGLDG